MKFVWIAIAIFLIGSTFVLSYFAMDSPANIGTTTAEVQSIHTIVLANTSGGKKERHYAKARLENDKISKIWLAKKSSTKPGAMVPLMIMKSPLSGEVNYQLNPDSYKAD